MSRRRKNAGEGYGYMFHGAYGKKADAVEKEKTLKGAWIRGTPTNRGYRYLVMSPRENPRKRRRNPSIAQMKAKAIAAYAKLAKYQAAGKPSTTTGEYKLRMALARINTLMGWTMADVARMYEETPHKNPAGEKKISLKEFRKLLRAHGYGPGAAVRGVTRSQALEMIHRLDENLERYQATERAGFQSAVRQAGRHNPGYFSERIPAGHGHGIVIWANDPSLGPFHVQPWVNDWDTPGREVGKYKTLETARKKAHSYIAKMGWRAENSVVWGKRNPMDLVVMGANPSNPRFGQCRQCGQLHNLVGGYCAQCRPDLHRDYYSNPAGEIPVHPGQTITLRVNPASPLSSSSDDSRYMRQAAAELYGKTLEQLTARELSQVAMRAAQMKAADLRGNPQAVCGAMIGGYRCSRKPGHRGPHLPQGATLRPRSRHNWGKRGNPSAEAIREYFTGMPVGGVTVQHEGHMPAGDYALLGKLLVLYVKPCDGGQVQKIMPRDTRVVCDESARQIYFVGGDQDVTDSLQAFGARDLGGGLFELGEARRIDYKQRKAQFAHPDVDEWQHHFGEESGVLPRVLFDTKHKRLMLEGGEYVVRSNGIVN